jgi:hypothetical protein
VTISGEWEGQYYEYDKAVQFLKDVVELMLLLIETD